MDGSSSSLGCTRRNRPMQTAFEVLNVWWKTSASGSVLFRAVLRQRHSMCFLDTRTSSTSTRTQEAVKAGVQIREMQTYNDGAKQTNHNSIREINTDKWWSNQTNLVQIQLQWVNSQFKNKFVRGLYIGTNLSVHIYMQILLLILHILATI